MGGVVVEVKGGPVHVASPHALAPMSLASSPAAMRSNCERLRVRCVIRAEPDSEESLNNELLVATEHVRAEKECADSYVTLVSQPELRRRPSTTSVETWRLSVQM